MSGVDHFKIFDIPKTFNVNLDKLKSEYYQRCKKYSPENPQNVSEFQKLNKSYKTLTDDYKRAKHLFVLRNGRFEPKVTTEFLEEIMQKESDIQSANISELEMLKTSINDKIQECKKKHYENESLSRWKYYTRLQKSLQERRETNNIFP